MTDSVLYISLNPTTSLSSVTMSSSSAMASSSTFTQSFSSPISSLPHCNPHILSVTLSCPSSSGYLGSRRSLAVSAAFAGEEKRQLFLERYGVDLAEFDSPKKKQLDGKGRKGKGVRPTAPPEEPKPPRTTHKLFQVLGGTARRRKLISPKGLDVRPMMEVVRGAAFDILQIKVAGGRPASLRPGGWLDLYSGTGSVGIEAISRGCSEVHFVEMDPWVVSEVLKPNLEWTGFLDVSTIHMVRVENFIDNAEKYLVTNGSFDYISVTPPYTQVDYEVLMKQLSESPLVGKDTFIVVEYPFKTDMSYSCGCLVKIADRRFGRTNLAMYGPTWSMKKKK